MRIYFYISVQEFTFTSPSKGKDGLLFSGLRTRSRGARTAVTGGRGVIAFSEMDSDGSAISSAKVQNKIVHSEP